MQGGGWELGRTEVAISWLASEKKLTKPTLTPSGQPPAPDLGAIIPHLVRSWCG
ncbi:hypothetical protein JOD67_003207 [Tenggerimyces flavus]|nr:hypothetical protein [Tenggerimyces flavus]